MTPKANAVSPPLVPADVPSGGRPRDTECACVWARLAHPAVLTRCPPAGTSTHAVPTVSETVLMSPAHIPPPSPDLSQRGIRSGPVTPDKPLADAPGVRPGCSRALAGSHTGTQAAAQNPPGPAQSLASRQRKRPVPQSAWGQHPGWKPWPSESRTDDLVPKGMEGTSSADVG